MWCSPSRARTSSCSTTTSIAGLRRRCSQRCCRFNSSRRRNNGGTVERWNGGTVERWNGGTGERWNGGTVEGWNGGTVERNCLALAAGSFQRSSERQRATVPPFDRFACWPVNRLTYSLSSGEPTLVRMPFIPVLCAAVLALTGCDKIKDRFSGPKTAFDGQAALAYVKAHLEFGPRTPGTAAHEKAGDWIVAEMKKRTDSVTVQQWTQTTAKGLKLPMRNILA